jgi:predicted ABC-type transport system involved in lysophospholipase L1 biosynthesis ATPase subunit
VSDPVLSARDIEVAYSAGATSVLVLKGVSTSIEAGLVTLIQGPSGSGKTTLLSVLGCLRQPDSGSLFAFGRDVSSLSAKGLARLRRERIGLVFQSFRLFSRLNARQNDARSSSSSNPPSLSVTAPTGHGRGCWFRSYGAHLAQLEPRVVSPAVPESDHQAERRGH